MAASSCALDPGLKASGMNDDLACQRALMSTIGEGAALDLRACAAVGAMSLDQAYRAQRRAVTAIGPPSGYKIALATRASQAQFGMSEPAIGTLRDPQFQATGAVIALTGNRDVMIAFEPDLLVTVSDAAINEAETIEHVVAALGSVSAFAEVPQLLALPADASRAAMFVATNAGARLGIVGDTIPLDRSDVLERLSAMRVTVVDEQGQRLSAAQGCDLMGHPLNPALFLVRKLRAQGIRLAVGDRISLGSFAPPRPAQPGTYRVVYEGLGDEPLMVEVTFG
jgi:2-keto-4-pentenoate hydratase